MKIKSLEDLRLAKKQIRLEMKIADSQVKDNIFVKSFDSLNNLIGKQALVKNTPITSGVAGTMGFLSKQVEKKFNLGKKGKIAMAAAILILTPIIASKIQNFIDEKIKNS